MSSRVGAVVLLLMAAVYLGCTLTGGWDIWWHMLVGRVAVAKGSALPTDIFSHTMAGVQWPHKDLVAAVIMWAGFDKLGFAWFAILKGLVVVAVAAGVHLSVSRSERRPVISILTAGLAIAAIQYRLVERPLLFSLAFFPLLLMLLERIRTCDGKVAFGKMVRLWLPVLGVSWVWLLMHRGGLVGIGLILAHALDAWAGRFFGGRASRLFAKRNTAAAVTASVALLCALGLSFATPSGYHLHLSSMAVAGSDALRAVISDWSPIGVYELLTDFPVTAFLAVSALVAGGIAVIGSRGGAGSRPGLMHMGLAGFFLLLTLVDSVRWVPYLSITSAITLGLSLATLAPPLGRALPRLLVGARGWPLLLGVGILCLISWRNDLGTGVGPMPGRYSQGAVDFAMKHKLEGKAINSFHLGGYLMWKMWPGVTVSLDGRNDLIYPPEVLLKGISSQTDARVFEDLQTSSGANWVFASNIPGHLSHGFLFEDPEWSMVYWSEAVVVYIRSKKYPELEDLSFRLINPSSVDNSVVSVMTDKSAGKSSIVGLQKELARMLVSSPDSLRANAAMAVYLHLRGVKFHGQRDTYMGRLMDLHGGHPVTGELARRFHLDTDAAKWHSNNQQKRDRD